MQPTCRVFVTFFWVLTYRLRNTDLVHNFVFYRGQLDSSRKIYKLSMILMCFDLTVSILLTKALECRMCVFKLLDAHLKCLFLYMAILLYYRGTKGCLSVERTNPNFVEDKSNVRK